MGTRRGPGRPRKYTTEQAYDRLVRLARMIGMPPTVREFQDGLGLGSSRTALAYLDRLEDAGLIARSGDSRARGMRIKGMIYR